jgi:hypothetical protein
MIFVDDDKLLLNKTSKIKNVFFMFSFEGILEYHNM